MFERNRFFNKLSLPRKSRGKGGGTSYTLLFTATITENGYFPKASQSNGNYK